MEVALQIKLIKEVRLETSLNIRETAEISTDDVELLVELSRISRLKYTQITDNQTSP